MQEIQLEELRHIFGLDRLSTWSIDDFNQKEVELINEIGLCFFTEFSFGGYENFAFDSLLNALNECERCYYTLLSEETDKEEIPERGELESMFNRTYYIGEYFVKLRNVITYIMLISGKYKIRNVNDDLEAARQWKKKHGKNS